MSVPSEHVLVIAEAGVNHNGDVLIAKKLIDAAAAAGADVVKFQTFRAEQVISAAAPQAEYQQRNTGSGENQLEMVRKLELSANDHTVLMEHARHTGIRFLSTPFDLDSITLLKGLGITLGKVPSGEVTNLPYLQAMAKAFPELIMSTGMCTLEEVGAALSLLERVGAKKDRITLLHCNTEYPTPMQDVHLRAMHTLAQTFGLRVGYSDHTLGIEVPIAAVALGAVVIEKHITLDRGLPGPDHRASLEPTELTAMVRAIRNIERALGSPAKEPSPSELPNRTIARKSIHLKHALTAGCSITAEDLIMLRPGDGISPMQLDKVIGRAIRSDLPSGHKLSPADLS
jgi:N,N'-diacetyllegionaminate synthase